MIIQQVIYIYIYKGDNKYEQVIYIYIRVIINMNK